MLNTALYLPLSILTRVVDRFIDNCVLYDKKKLIVGFEQIPKFSSLPKRVILIFNI